MSVDTLSDGGILWVVDCGADAPPADPIRLSGSPIASQRMRVAAPAAHLADLGLTQRAASMRDERDFESLRTATPSVAIFSKLLGTAGMEAHLERHERLAGEFGRRGIPVVIDVCDNYFIAAAAPYLVRMIKCASRVVANSDATADLIAEATGIKASVIGDPVESARSIPAFNSPVGNLLSRFWRRTDRPLNLLWYGGPLRSFEPLQRMLPGLTHLSTTVPIDLHLVTAKFEEVEAAAQGVNNQENHLRARLTPWSRESIRDAISAADLVILPGDASDPSRFGASANRLAEAIWGGRYVVASGIASYWEFREAASVGDDVIAGVLWACRHAEEVRRRIALGQKIIQARYTPQAIGHAWRSLVTEIIGS